MLFTQFLTQTHRELFARCQCAVVCVGPIERPSSCGPTLLGYLRRRPRDTLPSMANADVLFAHRDASAHLCRAALARGGARERLGAPRATSCSTGVRVGWVHRSLQARSRRYPSSWKSRTGRPYRGHPVSARGSDALLQRPGFPEIPVARSARPLRLSLWLEL